MTATALFKTISGPMLALCLIMALAVDALGAGPVADKEKETLVSKSFKIGDFDRIEVGKGIKVVFRQSKNPGVARATASAEAIERLRVYVKDRKVVIGFESGVSVNAKGPVTVAVGSADFKGAEVKSAAELKITGDINVPETIKIDANSAGKVIMNNVACGKLKIDASSAASVAVKALAGCLDIDVSSASDVNVGAARGAEIKIEASSASSVTVAGIKAGNVDAEASSTAKVSLEGVCSSFNKDVSSAAVVKHGKLVVRK